MTTPYPTSVLVVDDFPTMRRIFRNLFRELGTTNISEAARAADALTRLQQGHVDLTVVSVDADNADGLDLIRAIRADSSLRAIPVLAYALGRQQVDSALQAGANGYISWPLTAGILHQKIGPLMHS